MRIAILYICTGKYNQFFSNFYKSCEQYFFHNTAEKEYFVFTDDFSIANEPNVHLYHKECQGFPMDSLLRFEQFLRVKDELIKFDYVYFFNASALFLRAVGEELLPKDGTLYVAGVWNQNLKQSFFLPYERNKKSKAYIPPHDGPYVYFGGFFNGGNAKAYVDMADELALNTQKDLKDGIIAKVHDESHLNHYLHYHPCTALPTSYIIPEEFMKDTDNPFIMLRDKVRLDLYFNKGRKHTLWANVKKAYDYIYNAIKWYF